MNDDCCYKLYMHINKTNGKVYIGQTKQSCVSRWGNGKGYGHCSRFAKAIKKYGWDSFEHIQLIEGLSKIEVDYFERFFIAFFDSQNPEFGYNLTAGGDENPLDNPVVRVKHGESVIKRSADPEYQKNHREALKKMHADPEYQKNHREALKKMHADPEWQENVRKGAKKRSADPKWHEAVKKRSADPEWQENVRKGAKKRSADPEYQKNHREAMKKRSANPEWLKKLSKKVLCVETKIVYDSQQEAAIAVNLKKSSGICLCCGGKQKTAGGYHWEYA